MATVQRTFAFASNAEAMTDQAVSGVAFAFEGADGNPAGSVKFTFGAKGATASERGATSGLTWQDYGVPAGATVNSVRVVSYSRKVAAVSKLSGHSHVIRVGGRQCASETLPTATGGWLAGGGIVAAGAPVSGADLEIEYTVTTLGGGGTASVDARFDQILVEVDYTLVEARSGSFAVSHPHTASDAGAKAARGAAALQLAHDVVAAGRKAAAGVLAIEHAQAMADQGAKAAADTFTATSGHTVALVGEAAGAPESSGSFTQTHVSTATVAGAKAMSGAFVVSQTLALELDGTAARSSTVSLAHPTRVTAEGGRKTAAASMAIEHGQAVELAGAAGAVESHAGSFSMVLEQTGVWAGHKGAANGFVAVQGQAVQLDGAPAHAGDVAIEVSVVVLVAGMNHESTEIAHPLDASVSRRSGPGATIIRRPKPRIAILEDP